MFHIYRDLVGPLEASDKFVTILTQCANQLIKFVKIKPEGTIPLIPKINPLCIHNNPLS